MNCMYCKDERVIWVKNKGQAPTCQPCLKCNQQGHAIQAETRRLKALRAKQMREDTGGAEGNP